MFGRRVFLLLLVAFLSLKVRAEVFIVTSNADSGPGTLREALTLAAANGSTEKDYINFNLPDLSEAGRTITVASELPWVSSNLVIDGSTQPGNKFGVSDAKVILQPVTSDSPFNAFVIVDVTGFEIYSLYVRDFLGEFTNGPSQSVNTHAAVLYIETSNDIQIGAQGKGNVFTHNGYIEATTYVSIKDHQSLPAYGVNNLKVYANFLGFEPDGKTGRGAIYDYSGGMDLSYCKGTIEIGGPIITQRNIFGFGTSFITGFFTGPDRSFPSTFLIENNYFGYDVDGVAARLPDINSSSISAISFNISRFIYSYDTRSYPYTFSILNNKIQSPYQVGVSRVSGNITFQGNQLLNDPDRPANGPSYEGGIGFSSDANIVIGGEQPGEANIIYGAEVDAISRKSVLIQRNSIYCVNETRGIWYPLVPYMEPELPLPVVEITKITPTSVSGTATALSKVELFWDDDCRYCQPLTYITTVNADVAGKWEYTGAIQKGVIASATLNGFTSLFTKAAEVKSYTITHTSCGKTDGVIKTVGFNAGGYHWKDEAGIPLGATPEITNLAPGKYILTAENGTCSKDYTFEIFDATPKIDDRFVSTIQPSCNVSGSVKNLFLDNGNIPLNDYTYRWLDDAGNTRSSNLELHNAEAGTYRLEVTYKNECTATYGPVTLVNSTGPSINEANPIITPTRCYESTGSITGITATGAGTLTYSWRNETNLEVGTSADLTNQPPGKYMLMVTDESNCGPLYSSQHEIPGVNDITINTTNKNIKPATCDNFDGGISNLTITGANLTYSWKNDKNAEVSTNKDLIGVPAGTYTLTVTGSTYCPPVTSQPITIQSTNGVSLDLTNQGGRSATCNESNGSITGLKAPGATTYQWATTGTNAIVGSQLDLKDVPAGFYTLTVSNATCSKSYDFEVAGFPPTVFTDITYTSTKSCQAFNSGTITLNTQNANAQPLKYRWVNSTGDNVGFDKIVQFLPPGTYKLYLTDNNYCENLYGDDYVVEQYPEFKVLTFGTVTNTQCGVGIGAISATTVTGGTANYTYQWLDADNNDSPITGKNESSIGSVLKGHYKLRITDGGCSLAEIPYTIADEAATPPLPSVNDIQVYNTGSATITVNNPFATAIYRLYETATSPAPVDQEIGGNFNINVSVSRSYYVSLTYGYCESDRAEVKIFLSALNGNIPNTFTPNGDGINDYWNIPGLNTYPGATVNIFNRYGTSVFQSTGYAKPFDGNLNGKPLPAGVYYYIINLKKGDVLSGNVTIIR